MTKVAIANKSFKLNKCNQNDFKRFIKKTTITKDGELAENKVLSLNTNTIQKEEEFDDFMEFVLILMMNLKKLSK